MSFHIRQAVISDAPTIASIHTQCWTESFADLMPSSYMARMTGDRARRRRTYHWTEQIRETRLLTGQQVGTLVAEERGRIVGFASGGDPRDHPGYDKELMTLFVEKSCHGLGVGKLLLGNFMVEMSEAGGKSLALWVLATNPARAWYARQGAKEAGQMPVSFDGYDLHEVRMVWCPLSVSGDR
ncbi:N-acetyltransferase [Deinococcus malanensis]|uniref:N-acetyltransferase n=1 Tax=Deinococcus malanensis TaxID=1706855 RepID=A0ABQ2EIU4_9DEIO|nr:GNAT family N-acetyltransferase [Deinococcus malanensis]GGK13675.1 N-acetyltransferase [Deinococcus malanensis]